MSDLQIFTYEGMTVRTIEREDGLWWVLKDVCGILGITDHKQVKKRLDDDEKGVCQVPPPPSGGQAQNMIIINEPGLYSVILRSDKPEAKDFKRWVTMDENLFRIYTLRDMGFDPFVMVYDKTSAPREIRLLQRWCNNRLIFRAEPDFYKYDPKRGGNCDTHGRHHENFWL